MSKLYLYKKKLQKNLLFVIIDFPLPIYRNSSNKGRDLYFYQSFSVAFIRVRPLLEGGLYFNFFSLFNF